MQNKLKTALVVSTGLAGLVAGGVLMTGLSANAADSGSSGSSGSYGAPPAGQAPSGESGVTNPNPGDPSKPQRSDEQLLTGTTKDQVTAAVKAKYPNATFVRVETDSDGVYEAHVTVGGKPITVEVDKSFTVTGTEAAPTGRPGGGDGDGPAAQQPAA